MLALIMNSAITLCMLALVYRLSAPYLEVDIHRGRFRWLPPLTDPYVATVRKLLPPSGAFDLAPFAAIAGLWLLRVILTGG